MWEDKKTEQKVGDMAREKQIKNLWKMKNLKEEQIRTLQHVGWLIDEEITKEYKQLNLILEDWETLKK